MRFIVPDMSVTAWGLGSFVPLCRTHSECKSSIKKKLPGLCPNPWVGCWYARLHILPIIKNSWRPEDRSQDLFDTLKALVIENTPHGKFAICGDFNARCGNLQDCVMEVCSLKTNRDVIDSLVNPAGRNLIEFLQTMELCMLNGRFGKASLQSLVRVWQL